MLYTIFTPRQKQLLTFLLGFASITSPLTATIYFPLLPLLRTHFHTSAQAINLTITIYIIFQAVSPALFATLSDSLGRRAVYLITLTLYLLANIGLALNKDSYAALLVLRALQSLGASAAFAVSFGVVADVCVPAERGKMLGPVSMALNLGTCVGPVVGGWVALRSGGYDWVFWFLVVVGGVLLVAVGGFLPETARSVVGNGSLQARRWWETSWWSVLVSTRCRKQSQTGSGNDEVEGRIVHSDREGPVAEKTRKINLGNPLACLRIIFWKDTGLVLWMHGSFYLVDYCIQTAIPSAYKDLYHFNELEIGLSYLPRGTGIILGGYINGRMMDRNYRLTAKKIGHTVNRVSGDDLNHFPIERARTRGSWYLLGTLTIVLIGYGWALEQHSHVSIPLMLQFLQGFLGTCIYTIYNTLLVDIFPESPSTAAAAASITRCALAASGVAALQPLLDTLGRGWFFTALGLASGGAGLVAVWAIQTYGMKWRGQRLAQTTKAREDNVSAHT
jgi:MFS family permease